VLINGTVPSDVTKTSLIWRAAAAPADNSGTEDMGVAFDRSMLSSPGSKFILAQMPVSASSEVFMHATDTVDYLVMLEGEVELILKAGVVRLGPGDLVVDRGIIHGWRNAGSGQATFASIMIEARPLEAGPAD